VGASYAVTWKDSEGSTDAGRLALGSQSLRLDGASSLEVAYDDLIGVSVGRGTGDRLGGRTTIVLNRRSGRPIWIAPVVQHLALLELFDRLAAVSAEQ
jgi:hypothetical protein